LYRRFASESCASSFAAPGRLASERARNFVAAVASEGDDAVSASAASDGASPRRVRTTTRGDAARSRSESALALYAEATRDDAAVARGVARRRARRCRGRSRGGGSERREHDARRDAEWRVVARGCQQAAKPSQREISKRAIRARDRPHQIVPVFLATFLVI
jgi:hypothetical protein